MAALLEIAGLVAMTAGTGPTVEPPRFLCASAGTKTTDSEAYVAATAIFPAEDRGKSESCVFPLKLLHYADADVLLTRKGSPNDHDCHPCGARLSAYVLRHTPAGPKAVATFSEFVEIGTFGYAGQIAATRLAGHDAFGVRTGFTGQGYTYGWVVFFVLRDGRLDEIKPQLPLDAGSSGDTSGGNTIDVDGAWRVDPRNQDRVIVDYRTNTAGKTHRSSTTWRVDGKDFRLIDGQIPDSLRNRD